MDRNTSGVNLHVSGVGHVSTLTVASHSSRTVTAHCIRRKEVSISVTTGSDNYRMSSKALQLTSHQVLGNDTTGTSVNDDNVLHFVTGIELYLTGTYLTAQCRVSTEEELLASLTLGIECT